MKISLTIILIIIIGLVLNFTNYNFFLTFISIIWYIASILLIYLAIKSTHKYQFIQFKIKNIMKSLKSKSHNNISPISSLCLSLAAKIGVGSISGIALAIYFGGVGTIIWIIIISLLTAINTYVECIIGMKSRYKYNHILLGGPSYYIKKYLNNPTLSIIYSILIIISYSILFLSIQTNTIITITNSFNIASKYITLLLLIIVTFTILKGIDGITKFNHILVPLMLLIYFMIGITIIINNYYLIPRIIMNSLKEAFKIKSIIPVFTIGMERAIFITESSIGTSAIASSTCDNEPEKQALLEVLGIYITIFIVALTTYLIIITSNYEIVNFKNYNGIDLVMYAFNYHFGNLGRMLLALITIMFALSTIISSYFFGENNLLSLTKNKYINILYKIVFALVLIVSNYFKPLSLWHLTDFFVAILIIINTYSIIKIQAKYIL